ncbi:MAG: hypothetical protein HZB80_05635 [Deltaproteobacteria bacterium]|nr:hypothetical protein [Deltaproteobacteria bacterium]
MRRSFAIVLLLAVITMNMDMVCQSLCLAGRGDMAGAHSSHKTTNHEMPKADMFPVTHHDTQESHHNMPQTSIKCDCPADQVAVLGFELTIADTFADLKPSSHIISKIHSQKVVFLSNIPIPLEGPPKLIS